MKKVKANHVDLTYLADDKVFLFFFEKNAPKKVYAMWFEEMEKEIVKEIALEYGSEGNYNAPHWENDEEGGHLETETFTDAEKVEDLEVNSIMSWLEDNWKEFIKNVVPYDETGEHNMFIVDKNILDEYDSFFAKKYLNSEKAIEKVMLHLEKYDPQMVHPFRGTMMAKNLGIL